MPERASILLAVLLCSFGLAAQEVPVSSIDYGPAPAHEITPLVAGNGELFLVVWTRAGGTPEVRTARVSTSGELLDQRPLTIADARRETFAHALAWSGRYFLVAWTERAVGSRALVSRIDRDGRIVGELELGDVWPMSLTCHAAACLLVAAQSTPSDRKLEAFILTPDGELDRRVVIADLPGSHYSASAATDGSDFVVIWRRFGADLNPRDAFYTTRISGDGARGRMHTLSVAPVGGTLERGKSGYVVAWGQGSGLGFLRLSDDGSPIGGATVAALPNGPSLGRIVLVPDGSGYLAVARTASAYPSVVAFRLGAGGQVESGYTVISESAGHTFDAASSGGNVLVTWSESSATGLNVYAQLFTPSAHAITDRVVMSVAARPQYQPSIAWDGEQLFTVWEEAVEGRYRVRMSILDRAAVLVHERSVDVSQYDQTRPQIAVSATGALVVWEEVLPQGWALFARRFSRSGDALDADRITVTMRRCSTTAAPAVATDGRDFLVAWMDCAEGKPIVTASRIIEGAVADRISVSAGSTAADVGGVAWNGSQYVVSWLDQRLAPGVICDPTPCYLSNVRASRIDGDGVLHDPIGIVLSPELYISNVESVAAGEDVLVAWSESTQRSVRAGARVRPDGSSEPRRVLMPLPFTLKTEISTTWDGANFFMVWGDHPPSRASTLMAAVISPAQLDRGEQARPFPIAAITVVHPGPVVVATAPGRLVLAYSRLAREPEYGNTARVFARPLRLGGGRNRAVGR